MQRVAIGRALINDPRIILADEPTGNLDSATSEMIFELFRQLNRQGMTVVVVTHNLDLARRAQKMYTLRGWTADRGLRGDGLPGGDGGEAGWGRRARKVQPDPRLL